jgi:hypothetical protein
MKVQLKLMAAGWGGTCLLDGRPLIGWTNVRISQDLGHIPQMELDLVPLDGVDIVIDDARVIFALPAIGTFGPRRFVVVKELESETEART